MSLAGGTLGGTTLAGSQSAYAISQSAVDASIPDLYITSPILVFFEITASNGDVQRVVDYADPYASASEGYVDFDGESWLSLSISAPRVEESLDGRSPAITVSLSDPTRSILTWVVAHDKLRGASVTIRIIELDDLDTPALSTDRTYRVKQVQSLEGPPRLSVTFGSPSLHDLSSPHIQFNRFRCSNSWPKRFDHTYRWNCCFYPSDNFEVQTAQSLEDAADTEAEKHYGWYVINGSRPGYFKIGGDYADPKLTVSDTFTAGDPSIWDDAARDGAYAYKVIPGAASGSDSDFDVHSVVNIIGTKGMIGLLIQDATNASTWLLWSYRAHSGTYELLSRKTVSDVSTDSTYSITGGPRALRILRDGTSFYCYEQSTTLVKDVITTGWTLRKTETITMTGDVRVGIALSASAAEAQTNDGEAMYLRFEAGGYTSCNRTLSDCVARKNTIRRNSFLALPDELPSSF